MGQSGGKRCPSPAAGRHGSNTRRPPSGADVALGAGGADRARAPGRGRGLCSPGSLGRRGPSGRQGGASSPLGSSRHQSPAAEDISKGLASTAL